MHIVLCAIPSPDFVLLQQDRKKDKGSRSLRGREAGCAGMKCAVSGAVRGVWVRGWVEGGERMGGMGHGIWSWGVGHGDMGRQIVQFSALGRGRAGIPSAYRAGWSVRGWVGSMERECGRKDRKGGDRKGGGPDLPLASAKPATAKWVWALLSHALDAAGSY